MFPDLEDVEITFGLMTKREVLKPNYHSHSTEILTALQELRQLTGLGSSELDYDTDFVIYG